MPQSSTFSDARPYDVDAQNQTYYITAAWDDPNRVPTTFIVGNRSVTVARGTTYLNARLKSNTDYLVFFRVEIASDNGEVS